MNFNEAINYVLDSKTAAYTSVPKIKNNNITGGFVYVLEYEAELRI